MRVAYEIGDFFFRYISPSHLSLSLFTFHESEWGAHYDTGTYETNVEDEKRVIRTDWRPVLITSRITCPFAGGSLIPRIFILVLDR